LTPAIADFIAALQLLEGGEGRDQGIAFLAEEFATAKGLKRDPGESEAEKEEEADAGGLLGVVHGVSRVRRGVER